MTISRSVLLAAWLLVIAGTAGAQSMPKDLPWAVAELNGGGEWAVRLPQLLVRGWENLPNHQLSDDEQAALRNQFRDDTLTALDHQSSDLQLALDKKRLNGAVPASEPAATEKALAEIEDKRSLALAGKTPGAEPPKTLAFRAVWSTGREKLPWGVAPRSELVSRSKALYLVSGSVRTIGTYLSVRIELFSDLEKRVLSAWEGQFSPDEAPERIAEAADQFRSFLFGRPWSGLSVVSSVPGSKVKVLDRWHNLPWSSDELDPGTMDLAVQNPGRADEVRTVVLEPGVRTSLVLDSDLPSVDPIVLETEPPGAALYMDSRYLGLSPQTVDRPLNISRIRAQASGWATTAWEIGPQTVSPSKKILLPPVPAPSVPDAKDRFYGSLAAFSFSLTSTVFLGAWWDEQSKLMRAYGAVLDPSTYDNYKKSYDRYWWTGAGYAAGVVLTSGVFVWMMVELGDYLGAAQASLP